LASGWSSSQRRLLSRDSSYLTRCASNLVKEKVHEVSSEGLNIHLRRTIMNLDDFIITCFCLIDEMIPMITKDQRLRARGPVPKLADSEVITMEVVGSYLGLSQDQELFEYFQRHSTHFFPALDGLHRTTFVRQAANL